MSNGRPPNGFALLLGLAVFLFLVFRKKSDPDKKRRDDLAAVAVRLDLAFRPDHDTELIERYSFLNHFNSGVGLYAYNIFSGDYGDYRVLIFDRHFDVITVGGRSGTGVSHNHYYYSIQLVEMPTDFPALRIQPETWSLRLAEALGRPRIVFESTELTSAEFMRAFSVHSFDKKFADDVCHHQMMKYLLANRDLSVEISRSALVLHFETWLHASEIEKNLLRLIEIRKLLPNCLFTEN